MAVHGHLDRGLSVGFGVDLGEVEKRASFALVDIEIAQTEGNKSQQADEQSFSLCHLSRAIPLAPRTL